MTDQLDKVSFKDTSMEWEERQVDLHKYTYIVSSLQQTTATATFTQWLFEF